MHFNSISIGLTYLARTAVLILALILGVNTAHAATSITISDEAYGNNAAGRSNADILDNVWGASYPTGAHKPDLFSGGAGYTGANSFTDPTGASYQVDWQVGRIDQIGPGLPTSTTFILSTGGSVTYGPSNKIQSNAPNPYSADTRLTSSVSGAGLKAVKLDFTNSATDIYEFGVYVGDLESRPNNGTVGRVIIYDPVGLVIGDHPIIYTGTVKTSGADITYTVTEPSGAATGNANNNDGDWGNATTAFISVTSDTVIGSVVFHVGDDDHTTNNTGSTEQLGLVGFQIPAEPIIKAAELVASKSVDLFDTAVYALPGDDVVYSILVTNQGTGPVDNDTIFIVDALPADIVFFNGDMDGAGPATGAVKFTQTGSGLTFTLGTDVKYAEAGTAPSNYAACTYSPISGYDPAVKYICFNPKGAMANGSPFPEFSVDFRAQIK